MSNKEYKSAMSKIEASDTWKTQTLTKMKTAALKQAAEERQIENARQYLKEQRLEKAKSEQPQKMPQQANRSAQTERASVAQHMPKQAGFSITERAPELHAEQMHPEVKRAEHAGNPKREHAHQSVSSSKDARENEARTKQSAGTQKPAQVNLTDKQSALNAVLEHSRKQDALAYEQSDSESGGTFGAPNLNEGKQASAKHGFELSGWENKSEIAGESGAPILESHKNEHKYTEQNGAPVFDAEQASASARARHTAQIKTNTTNEIKDSASPAGTRGQNGPQYKKNSAKIKRKKRMIMLLASTAALFFIGFGFVFNAILGQNMGSDAAPNEAQQAQPELFAEAPPAEQAETEAQMDSAGFANESDIITQIEGVVTQQTESSVTLLLADGSTKEYIIDESTVLPEGDLADKNVIVSINESESELAAKEIAVIISQ